MAEISMLTSVLVDQSEWESVMVTEVAPTAMQPRRRNASGPEKPLAQQTRWRVSFLVTCKSGMRTSFFASVDSPSVDSPSRPDLIIEEEVELVGLRAFPWGTEGRSGFFFKVDSIVAQRRE